MRYHRTILVFAFVVLTSALLIGCAGSSRHESTGQYLDDSVITTRIKSAFVADKLVNASDIHVATFKGVVQLSGFVGSNREIDQAVMLARDVPGVVSVKNDIRRTPQSAGVYVDDSVITARIKSAFMADKEVSALDIRVETNDGVVLLSGFADSRQEKDRAVELASKVTGVKSVKDAIELKSSSS